MIASGYIMFFIPIICGIIVSTMILIKSSQFIYNFIFRDDKIFQCGYAKINNLIMEPDESTLGMIAILCVAVLGFLIGLILGTNDPKEQVSALWMMVYTTPVIPFILRAIVDVLRGLKLNHKTGELERIEKLEEELHKLKNK